MTTSTLSQTPSSSSIYYYLTQFWDDIQDPRTKNFPLVGCSPYAILAIMSFFLYFSLNLGPKMMKNRAPMDNLKPLIQVYNLTMAVSNAYFVYLILFYCDHKQRFFIWHYPDQSDTSPQALWEISMIWWYYITKYLDLFDTVFFVLRKKFDHLSFLHLYHHTMVPIFAYLCMKMNPFAPASYIFGLINGFIHVIMYTYYGLAAFGPHMQKYLWWKRYITQLQLGQFALYGIYGVVLYFKQIGYPKFLFWIALPQPFLFFKLFYNFYKKTYNDKKLLQKEQQLKKET